MSNDYIITYSIIAVVSSIFYWLNRNLKEDKEVEGDDQNNNKKPIEAAFVDLLAPMQMNEKTENLSKRIGNNNYPKEAWLARGLNPSDDDVIEEMNNDADRFINFLITNIGSENITNHIQIYFEDWERESFDTEEREFIFDFYFEVLDECGIKPDDIVL
tara:strand:+ start:754 stop:1230 length:477 start_codon:yes stop_codon:yes gene_type:complete